MPSYEVGSSKTVTVTFKNSAGNAADPTVVSVKVRSPATGTSTTYVHGTDAQVVKSSTGVYYINIYLNAPGDWHYRWDGSGALVAIDEGTISVRGKRYFP